MEMKSHGVVMFASKNGALNLMKATYKRVIYLGGINPNVKIISEKLVRMQALITSSGNVIKKRLFSIKICKLSTITRENIAFVMLFGSWQFEDYVHALTRTIYPASPPIAMAYAFVGVDVMTLIRSQLEMKRMNQSTTLGSQSSCI